MRGFSLIELVIVISIIGLLIGGIVGGQSLLRAVELRSIATEAKRYMAAAMAFKAKYQGLPGDMANATAFWGAAHTNVSTCFTTNSLALDNLKKTCNGDGNGRIDLISAISGSAGGGESSRFWQHLSNEGLIEGRYSGIYTVSLPYVWPRSGRDVPESPVEGAGYLAHYIGNLSGFSGWFDGEYGHILWAARDTSTACDSYELTPGEAFSVDDKFDDGKPGSGNVRSFANTSACAPCVTTTSAATALYSTASTGLSCHLMFPNAF